MADPILIARVVHTAASLARDKRVWKWIAILLSLLMIAGMALVSLPAIMVSSVFRLLAPTGDNLTSDPYYLAMHELQVDYDIGSELSVVVAKSVDLLLSGDVQLDVSNAKRFLLEHFVGSYEVTHTYTEPDPSNLAVDKVVEVTETVYYFVTATEMLGKLQDAPYSLSSQDINFIHELYLMADSTIDQGSFVGNLPMPVAGYITSGYGNRFDPINGKFFMHPAIDILPEWHSPISAISAGKVVSVNVSEIYGNNVTIMHQLEGRVIYSFSAHLSRVDVVEGDQVGQGQVIGLEGGDQQYDPNAGRTTGHHLHFEIWETPERSGHVNPSKYLRG